MRIYVRKHPDNGNILLRAERIFAGVRFQSVGVVRHDKDAVARFLADATVNINTRIMNHVWNNTAQVKPGEEK